MNKFNTDKRAENTYKFYIGKELGDIFYIYEHKVNTSTGPVVIDKSLCLCKDVDYSEICRKFHGEDLKLFNDVVKFVTGKYVGKSCIQSIVDSINKDILYLLKKVGF